MAGVIVAEHIGREVVDGIECEHLAFRDLNVDWQLSVEIGDRPIPRKYVITTRRWVRHRNTHFISRNGSRTRRSARMPSCLHHLR